MASHGASAGYVVPRLIATDLDGTLLRSDGTISDRTRRVLAQLEERGIAIVLVTARPPRWMASIAALTGCGGIAICLNGAATLDLHTGRVLEPRPIPARAARTVVERLRKALPDGRFGIETLDGFACEPGFERHQWDSDVQPPEADAFELVTRGVLKLVFACPGHPADALVSTSRRAVGRLVEVSRSNPERSAVEMSANAVTKAEALARLCAAREIERETVLTFGDMPNDLPLLRWAGSAVAVANAHPDVLSAADARCPSNDEDGVAAYLERFA